MWDRLQIGGRGGGLCVIQGLIQRCFSWEGFVDAKVLQSIEVKSYKGRGSG